MVGRENAMEAERALECLLSYITPVSETEEIRITAAQDRITAEDIYATHDQPPFPRSPLDGYAVRSADVAGADKEHPVTLRVIGEADAGHKSDCTVRAGEALRIMTGAPVPEGADCVIRQEMTDYGEDMVTIYTSEEAYGNYCFVGEDYKKGDLLIPAGNRIRATEIGILADLGLPFVRVRRRARILLLSTGDELMEPGEELAEGKIYDSNLYLLRAELEHWGAEVRGVRIIRDDAAVCAAYIREHFGDADLMISTGGVSVGKKDIMHEALDRIGATKLFQKVAIKPGSPFLAGLYRGRLLLCLTGNPFGMFVTLQQMIRPLYVMLTGREDLRRQKKKAVIKDGFEKKSPMRRFVRAYYENGEVFLRQYANGNGALSTLPLCNCLVELPAGTGALTGGETVWVHPF